MEIPAVNSPDCMSTRKSTRFMIDFHLGMLCSEVSMSMFIGDNVKWVNRHEFKTKRCWSLTKHRHRFLIIPYLGKQSFVIDELYRAMFFCLSAVIDDRSLARTRSAAFILSRHHQSLRSTAAAPLVNTLTDLKIISLKRISELNRLDV